MTSKLIWPVAVLKVLILLIYLISMFYFLWLSWYSMELLMAYSLSFERLGGGNNSYYAEPWALQLHYQAPQFAVIIYLCFPCCHQHFSCKAGGTPCQLEGLVTTRNVATPGNVAKKTLPENVANFVGGYIFGYEVPRKRNHLQNWLHFLVRFFWLHFLAWLHFWL